MKVYEDGFKKAMQEQKDRAKAATAKISVTGDMKYAKLEDEVGSEIPHEQAEKIKTVGDAVSYIESHQG